MIFPQLYKDELLKAIESIDLEKVGQAIEILAQARDDGRRDLRLRQRRQRLHRIAFRHRPGERRQLSAGPRASASWR